MGRPVKGFFDAFAAADEFDRYSENAWDAQGVSSLNTPGFVNMT